MKFLHILQGASPVCQKRVYDIHDAVCFCAGQFPRHFYRVKIDSKDRAVCTHSKRFFVQGAVFRQRKSHHFTNLDVLRSKGLRETRRRG